MLYYDRGDTYKRIVETLGGKVSISTVHRWVKKQSRPRTSLNVYEAILSNTRERSVSALYRDSGIRSVSVHTFRRRLKDAGLMCKQTEALDVADKMERWQFAVTYRHWGPEQWYNVLYCATVSKTAICCMSKYYVYVGDDRNYVRKCEREPSHVMSTNEKLYETVCEYLDVRYTPVLRWPRKKDDIDPTVRFDRCSSSTKVIFCACRKNVKLFGDSMPARLEKIIESEGDWINKG